jgi:hypothetical protein
MEDMMDPVALATAAISAALPYLASFGKEVAKGIAGGAGKSIWDWVKSKLSSPAGEEVIKNLESDPKDEDSRKMVEAALARYLRSDKNALGELAELLKEAGLTTGAQTATVVGDSNITNQAAGSGISISIGPANAASVPDEGKASKENERQRP